MIQLVDKGRKYKRFEYTPKEKTYLATQGLRWVLSSNVSAVGTSDTSLIIRFVNGSMYEYPNMAERYDEMFRANSKGKWVWRHIRRAGVPYRKIGSLPLPSDEELTDDELFDIINNQGLEDDRRLAQLGLFIANPNATLDLIGLNDLLA